MALVSDPSAEGFNSFVSVEEADEYFSTVYQSGGKKWSDFTDEADKEALLVTATRRLNSLPWGGAPYTATQLLAFPRNFASAEYGWKPHPHMAPVPVSGWPIPTPDVEVDVALYIPGWLKQATCELAQWIWSEDDRPATDAEFAMLKSQKIGPLQYEFRDSSLNLPPSVLSILGSLGSGIIDLRSGPRSMTMVY